MKSELQRVGRMRNCSLRISSPSTASWRPESVFDVVLTSRSTGFLSFKVTGEGAHSVFEGESGGHRWQRVPPTERFGRRHTSTVTVAVLDDRPEVANVRPEDVHWQACRGSGNGGQKRNKTNSAVRGVHVPTGVTVWSERQRSQHQNKASAFSRLEERITGAATAEVLMKENSDRKQQVGSGMRGDKIRTIRVFDGVVIDHMSGKKIRLETYLKGEWK